MKLSSKHSGFGNGIAQSKVHLYRDSGGAWTQISTGVRAESTTAARMLVSRSFGSSLQRACPSGILIQLGSGEILIYVWLDNLQAAFVRHEYAFPIRSRLVSGSVRSSLKHRCPQYR